ncbi:hypothetical protein [Micavibrio aeruginosavorus]|uniref:hypothetical protein n=1 Tax=Micavibrio aeruginosavorus TaxID=349221 RepID=UPI003F4AB6CC
MSTLLLIVSIIISIPVAWFLLLFLATYLVPAHKSGLALLKKKLRTYSIDPSIVPDHEWKRIVEKHINSSKGIATLSNNPEYKNWRANLVRALDNEVALVHYFITEDIAITDEKEETYKVLEKYGVFDNSKN